jgi:hypothetical protein
MLNDQSPWTELELADAQTANHFPDRRQRSRSSQDGLERRQFGSTYTELSAAGAELGRAIDSYKVAHHRRYVTYDEILKVLETLGYQRRTDHLPTPIATTDSPFSTVLPILADR